jgi:hypothetical protein
VIFKRKGKNRVYKPNKDVAAARQDEKKFKAGGCPGEHVVQMNGPSQ